MLTRARLTYVSPFAPSQEANVAAVRNSVRGARLAGAALSPSTTLPFPHASGALFARHGGPAAQHGQAKRATSDADAFSLSPVGVLWIGGAKSNACSRLERSTG